MRWFIYAIALLALSACDDDSTGPGPETAAKWVEVTAPAEVGRGSVFALSAGAGRVVALVHSENGEWVIEETSKGWTTVLGKPLPFLAREFASARDILFLRGSQDLLVSDDGRIYVVGATQAPGAPVGDSARTPATWAEAVTGWVLTPGPEDVGILLAAEWHAGVGIEAVGIETSGANLLTLRGTPETSLGWSSTATPYPGFDVYITDMALEGGTVYAGGILFGNSQSFGQLRGLLLQGSGGALVPLEAPCGECVGPGVVAVESRDGGTYWGGMIRERGRLEVTLQQVRQVDQQQNKPVGVLNTENRLSLACRRCARTMGKATRPNPSSPRWDKAIRTIVANRAVPDQREFHASAYAELTSSPRPLPNGYSLQVLPSSIRPAAFLFLPPHCLKKNGALASLHWSRISMTQPGSIGRVTERRFRHRQLPS